MVFESLRQYRLGFSILLTTTYYLAVLCRVSISAYEYVSRTMPHTNLYLAYSPCRGVTHHELNFTVYYRLPMGDSPEMSNWCRLFLTLKIFGSKDLHFVTWNKVILHLFNLHCAMDDFTHYKATIRGKLHPTKKAPHFLLQRVMAHYENLIINNPKIAKTIVSAKLDIVEGSIFITVTEESTLEFYTKNFVSKWNDSDDELTYTIDPPDEPRVKISIRMIDLGALDEEVYFKRLQLYNEGLDISSWRIPKDGFVSQGNGYLLLFVMVNKSSLEPLKANGKYFINTGAGGRSFVNVFDKKQSTEPGKKRKIGTDVVNPSPKPKGNGKGGRNQH